MFGASSRDGMGKKHAVCLGRDNNGTGRWEVIGLTGWDLNTRVFGGTVRMGNENLPVRYGTGHTCSFHGSGIFREISREHSRDDMGLHDFLVGRDTTSERRE